MEITPLLTCCCSFQGLGEPEQWLLDSCCLRAGSVNPKGTHLCISQLLQAELLPGFAVPVQGAGREGAQGCPSPGELWL